eukprot:2708993-Rhodomonas_salina.4
MSLRCAKSGTAAVYAAAPRNQIQGTAFSVRFVPGMRFLFFEFAVYESHALCNVPCSHRRCLSTCPEHVPEVPEHVPEHVPGTDTACAAGQRQMGSEWAALCSAACYAMSSTDLGSDATKNLRLSYAMSGTDLGQTPLSAYALATYPPTAPFPTTTRPCYPMSGTDLSYAPTTSSIAL